MSRTNVFPARGFRDYPPAFNSRRELLLATIRDVYTHHGFAEIGTPVVEPLERLRDSDGGENVGMIFEIQRRGLTSDDLATISNPHALNDLGLRYDLTVPLARFYATEHARLPSVARFIQIGPVWRAERPQKGRYRQFTQCDIDTIGEPGNIAEVELIVATLRALTAIGLPDAVVRLNDRRLLYAMLSSCGVPANLHASALVVIDKLDKIGVDGVRAQLSDIDLDAAPTLCGHLERFIAGPFELNDLIDALGANAKIPAAVIQDHQQIMREVRALAGWRSIRFDPSLVRGLGYYTGPIFEVEHPASGQSVGGGGRYDGMIGRFLNREVPACGFSLGFERLLELVPEDHQKHLDRLGVVYSQDAAVAEVLSEQKRLIEAGYRVTLIPRAKNMKRVYAEMRGLGLQSYVQFPNPEVLVLPGVESV